MSARAPRRAARPLVAIVAAFAFAGLLAGCGDISWAPPPTPVMGTGDMTVETRQVSDFKRISVSAPVKVTIGEAQTASISVEAQPDVLPLIATEVVDGQLVISMKAPGFETSDQNYPKLTVNAPGIMSVTLAGASIAYLETSQSEFLLDVSGQSVVTGIGTVPKLALSMAQASHGDLSQLAVTDATVKLTDNSDVTMTVTGSVTGVANGGATLNLTQTPQSQKVEIAGGGNVLVK